MRFRATLEPPMCWHTLFNSVAQRRANPAVLQYFLDESLQFLDVMREPNFRKRRRNTGKIRLTGKRDFSILGKSRALFPVIAPGEPAWHARRGPTLRLAVPVVQNPAEQTLKRHLLMQRTHLSCTAE
jgi:hypothetical protein